VRRAVADDVPAIAGVHVRAWRTAYRGLVAGEVLDRLTVEGRAQMWEELLAAEGEAPGTTVAEIDGAIVGFCTVVAPSRDGDAPPGTAEIPAIYVDPAWHRRGVGAALLEGALDGLGRRGWARVALWVIAANAPARAFYGRFGFAPDGASQAAEALGATLDRLVRDGVRTSRR